jgi:hypothetical protein
MTASARWPIWNAAPAAWSRARATFAKSLLAFCQSLGACLNASDAVLDGEIVCLGPAGKPQFSDLMRRRTEVPGRRLRFGSARRIVSIRLIRHPEPSPRALTVW